MYEARSPLRGRAFGARRTEPLGDRPQFRPRTAADLVADENLDPDLLLWDMRRNFRGGPVEADPRFVVRIEGSKQDITRFRDCLGLGVFAPAGREPPGQAAE